MTEPLPHARRPCRDCPWRLDSPPGQFPLERFEALRSTSDQSGLQAPMFACHQSAEGRDVACAGWLATEGHNHLGVRLAVALGRLNPVALRPRAGWPRLFSSYATMFAAKRARSAGSALDR